MEKEVKIKLLIVLIIIFGISLILPLPTYGLTALEMEHEARTNPKNFFSHKFGSYFDDHLTWGSSPASKPNGMCLRSWYP